jgi:hypothetical protein
MSCGRHHHLWSRRRAMLISIGRGLDTTHPGARSTENPHTPVCVVCCHSTLYRGRTRGTGKTMTRLPPHPVHSIAVLHSQGSFAQSPPLAPPLPVFGSVPQPLPHAGDSIPLRAGKFAFNGGNTHGSPACSQLMAALHRFTFIQVEWTRGIQPIWKVSAVARRRSAPFHYSLQHFVFGKQAQLAAASVAVAGWESGA